ncbi:hypothetical protein PoB_001443500 [Plakobranchus ocellatus]|uniref:Uncharacterized protein n=1 Tax=Plakobranchus ocellatus TaxID=259542 RepID=A0AAV3YYF2_9GAST|nr:hypothetical protein PoB_001443500 [Plakobranchus ocellatus]
MVSSETLDLPDQTMRPWCSSSTYLVSFLPLSKPVTKRQRKKKGRENSGLVISESNTVFISEKQCSGLFSALRHRKHLTNLEFFRVKEKSRALYSFGPYPILLRCDAGQNLISMIGFAIFVTIIIGLYP